MKDEELQSHNVRVALASILESGDNLLPLLYSVNL